MSNVRTIYLDWYNGSFKATGGSQLAYQYDHLSNLVIFSNAPKLDNYYLIVEMKETEDGEVRTFEPIQLAGSFWLIPNSYTQLAQNISFQVCCKTENGDFEHHSAQFTGTILPSKDHGGAELDVDPSIMYDPYKQWVSDIAMAAGAIVIDPTLSIQGAAADAKAVGNYIMTDAEAVNLLAEASDDEERDFIGDGILSWLDEHPEVIGSKGVINVAELGVDITGDSDASVTIQRIIDENPNSTIFFPDGSYKLLNTVKTWPDNARCVDLVFSKNAEFFTTETLECLFYVGGYDLNANYGTTVTLGYKKFFMGGRFDGSNCAYAVKVASGVCDLQVMNCLFFNCNSGLLMGHANTSRSTDSVVAYCNFIGTSAADSFGVRYSKADNKIQHCRIYGFKTAISSISGGLYAFDVHTLDLSGTPAGYDCDDSCAVDLSEGGGRNTLIAVYGNGEGTFCRLNGDNVNLIKITDCEYRNWTLSNSDFVFVDILGTLHGVHLVATGNTVIADNPGDTGKVRYGIRGPIYDFSLANNILWGTEYFTDRGDLLMQSMDSPYMPTANQTMTAEWWYYIGSMKLKSFANAYNITVTFSIFSFAFHIFASISSLATTGIYSRRDIHIPADSTFRLGFKQNGDTVDWYLGSEASTPVFPCIVGYVSEDGNKQYYLSNIYKHRNTESAYSQKGLGGSFSDFSVDKYFTITNAS